jgi:hypothetical protein
LSWERQIVASPFISNGEIAAGISPLVTVWQDSPPTGAKLREQMGQFVTKRPINFRSAMLGQSRIERNELLAEISAAGAGSQTRIPFHANESRKFCCSRGRKNFAYLGL